MHNFHNSYDYDAFAFIFYPKLECKIGMETRLFKPWLKTARPIWMKRSKCIVYSLKQACFGVYHLPGFDQRSGFSCMDSRRNLR